jgi:hypothetical protein
MDMIPAPGLTLRRVARRQLGEISAWGAQGDEFAPGGQINTAAWPLLPKSLRRSWVWRGDSCSAFCSAAGQGEGPVGNGQGKGRLVTEARP